MVLSKQGWNSPTGLPFTHGRPRPGIRERAGILAAPRVKSADAGVSIKETARQLGVVLPTVLNQVRAGRRNAVQLLEGKRRGLRIEICPSEQGLLTPAVGQAAH